MYLNRNIFSKILYTLDKNNLPIILITQKEKSFWEEIITRFQLRLQKFPTLTEYHSYYNSQNKGHQVIIEDYSYIHNILSSKNSFESEIIRHCPNIIIPAKTTIKNLYITWSDNFSWQESNGKSSWRWCVDQGKSKIKIFSFENYTSAQILFTIIAPHGKSIAIKWQGTEQIFTFQDQKCSITLSKGISRGPNMIEIAFNGEAYDPKIFAPNTQDHRTFYYSINDFKIKNAGIFFHNWVNYIKHKFRDYTEDYQIRSLLHDHSFYEVSYIASPHANHLFNLKSKFSYREHYYDMHDISLQNIAKINASSPYNWYYASKLPEAIL